jgi:enoyl-CoA hydratase/carnithine racemase
MTDNVAICKKEHKIVWLILNRPEKLNALNIALWRTIRSVIDDAQKEAEISVIVISGAGNAFCAGDDIKEFGALTDMKHAHILFLNEIYPALVSILTSKKPIIAAVNGLAYGGGCGLVMASDLAIASENATFALPEARIGILPGFPMVLGLSLIEKKIIFEMLFTGNPIDAEEAKRIGLVNKAVPSDQLTNAVIEMADQIAKSAPVTTRLMKKFVERQSNVGKHKVINERTDQNNTNR